MTGTHPVDNTAVAARAAVIKLARNHVDAVVRFLEVPNISLSFDDK